MALAQTIADRPIAPGDDGRLAAFLAALKSGDVQVGVRENLRAETLFRQATAADTPLAYARAMFTSLLARTPEEQARIMGAFDHAFGFAVKLVETETVRVETTPLSLGKRIMALINRANPAIAVACIAVLAAAFVAYHLAALQTVPPPNPGTPPIVNISPPPKDAILPKPEPADGVWTSNDLLADIDRLISEGKLSAAPTLRELQKAGWPPKELQGGVAFSNAELIRQTGLRLDEPLALQSPVGDRLGLVFGRWGVVPANNPGHVFQSEAMRFLEKLASGLSRQSDNVIVKLNLERDGRLAIIKGLLGFGENLRAPAGTDFDDLLDRVTYLRYNGGAISGGFPDAAWLPPPPAAVASPHPLLRPVAAAFPILLLALWSLLWINQRKNYLSLPPLRDDPLCARAVVNAPADILKNRTDKAWMASIARLLNVRQHVADIPVDPEKTVTASIAQGGLFTPVAGAITTSPAYLVLVEARSGFDQEGHRMEALVTRMTDAGINAVRYFYFESPAMLHSSWGARAEPVADIAALHNDRRLIVLGEGKGFLEPFALRPTQAALALTLWPDRALLTPKPVSEWAAEDFAIARALDLPLGRATVEGLAALAELMGLGGLRAPRARAYAFASGIEIPALPAAIRMRPRYWLAEAANELGDDADWQRLEAALRGYLDTPGLLWLAALAIYPALQWDLTLYLGRALKLNGRELYAEPRLAALTRLPWLREGAMPGWLRHRLTGLLPAGLKEDAVKFIWAILQKTDGAGTDAKRQGAPASYRGRHPLIDRQFKLAIENNLGMLAPPDWKTGFFEQLKDFAHAHWDKPLIAAVAAAIAWRIAPAAGETLGPGAYMPLTALFAIPAMAWGGYKIRDGSARRLLATLVVPGTPLPQPSPFEWEKLKARLTAFFQRKTTEPAAAAVQPEETN